MKMSPIAALALTAISLGYASAESRSPNNISDRHVAQGGGAPPCVGRNPHVAVPSAPHGMYVWLYSLDAQRPLYLFQKYVIGKDPALCGVSAVVSWSDVEKSKGSFDFSKVEQNLKPFVDAGLTVNLLFAAAGEGKDNTATPHWVMAEVPKTFCGGVKLPVYWNRNTKLIGLRSSGTQSRISVTSRRSKTKSATCVLRPAQAQRRWRRRGHMEDRAPSCCATMVILTKFGKRTLCECWMRWPAFRRLIKSLPRFPGFRAERRSTICRTLSRLLPQRNTSGCRLRAWGSGT